MKTQKEIDLEAARHIEEFIKRDKAPIQFVEPLKFIRKLLEVIMVLKAIILPLACFIFAFLNFSFKGSLWCAFGFLIFYSLTRLQKYCLYIVGCQCAAGNLYFQAKGEQ